MSIKKPAINYTSKEFVTIKNDLVNYAKRYYPGKFRDFTANSFGSLMLDTTAYVGDVLSFYLDYQVNESFLSTAIEYDNVVKVARQLGYRANLSPSSYGILTCFVLIPSSNGTPNFAYAPVVKRGSKFRTSAGKQFTLLEDINFKDTDNVEVVVGNVSATGVPLTYAIRAKGQAVSGEIAVSKISIGDYSRFRTVTIPGNNITEIIGVTDSEGNKYYEVDFLTQNTVHIPIINRGDNSDTVVNILKPISIPRRFTVLSDRDRVKLQFGFGTNEDAEQTLNPNNVLVKEHGKNYVTDTSFDPSTLLKTDKLGVVPSNTVLTIVYRINSTDSTNTGTNTIIVPSDIIFDFASQATLNASSVESVRRSLEVTNEHPFVGSSPLPSAEEIKQRAYGVYSMQNRMVTKDDFIAAVYNMPAKYGSIKKVNVVQDANSFNQRNINLYVISNDNLGRLVKANMIIKSNLKTFLSKSKMINDTIDILDAKIINLQIKFKIVSFPNVNKYSVLEAAKRELTLYYSNRNDFEIGEPFSITDIFAVLKHTAGVLDVVEVDVNESSGGDYATTNFNADSNKTSDARKIICPPDSIFEIKFYNSDIVGAVV